MKTQFLLLLSISLLLSACTDLSETSTTTQFEGFVTAHTQGPVSRCDDVFIQLGFVVDSSVEITNDMISFRPPLDGTLTLNPQRNKLVYTNASIKHNVTYRANLNIGSITEMPKGMRQFKFEFEAMRQSWNITMDPPVNKSMDEASYVGHIQYVDCEPDLYALESSLSATQQDRSLTIRWDHSDDKRRISKFTITGAKRTDEPDIIDLRLTMDAINVDDEMKLELPVPSRSDFSLHSIKDGNNALVTVVFTDPLKKGQNLTGLFSVDGRKIKQMKIRYNAVDIFFEGEQFGYYDLVIHPGILNAASFRLKDNYTRKLFFAPRRPSVDIAVPGNILPSDGSWKIPVNLNTASGFRFRILEIEPRNAHRFYQENINPYKNQSGLENLGRIILDTIYEVYNKNKYQPSDYTISLDNIVKRKNGSIYKLFLNIPQEYNLYPCLEVTSSPQYDMVDKIDFDQPGLHHSYGYYGRDQLGTIYYNDNSEKGKYDPCLSNYSYYSSNQRLLICTDVGVVIKSLPESDTYLAYLSRISSAEPIRNGKIELLNFQGTPIASAYTDANGFAPIHTDQIPFLARAVMQDQVTYLPLSDAKALSLSTFQVEGTSWEGGTKILTYGERDVWRPGDSIYMQTMVYDGVKAPPSNLPIALTLYDPTNKLVRTWNVLHHSDGLYDCRFNTAINAPTGNWRLEIKSGGTSHSTIVRVETIRPNRLKMDMAFSDPSLLTSNSSMDAPISVKWMHGMAGAGLLTEVRMFQKVLSNPFGVNFTGFAFDHASVHIDNSPGVVFTGKTPDDGIIAFHIPTLDSSSYPGQILFNFELRAFEQGGAFSTDMKDIRYSPFSSYVGMKLSSGTVKGINRLQSDDIIQVICVDEHGQKRNGHIKITIEAINWSWWYQFGRKGDFSAIKSNIKKILYEKERSINIEGVTINPKGGIQLITITDLESGHTVSRIVYAYNPNHWNTNSSEMSQLEVMPLHIEQTKYTIGEMITFDLPPAGKGRYLVTIESGGNILYKNQFAVGTKPLNIQIPVTKQMTPTAYVHVHFIQAWNSHTNNRPLRLFGIQPLEIYDPTTILQPMIEMPDEIEADESFSISIKEKEGNPMSYTLAVVDEGLLQLTQFTTPNPWSVFFAKERLNVKTWDMYRQIFHRFQGESHSLLAIGGDGSNAINATSKAQRFKPVVKFLGPFKLSSGQSQAHTIKIKDYVGAVRVMVVATNAKAVGHTEKTAEVKKPLMLYSTLPRVLGPGERLKVPVTVFAMDDNINSVDLSISSDENITFLSKEHSTLRFNEPGEIDTYFEIQVGNKIGPVTFTTTASSGAHIATERIEIDVRPSSPLITKTIHNIIEPGKEVNIEFGPIGMEGTRASKLSVSRGINFSFQHHAAWLSQYPHGCLEQTVSSVFPQIFLSQMNLLDDAEQLRSRQHYEAAIQKLRYMQLPNGGFSYWKGGSTPNSWGTTYALHFLIEAKNLGYRVPEDLLSKCVKYQYKAADKWAVKSTSNNRPFSSRHALDQAYRLYTLVLAGRPNYAAINRLRLIPQLETSARWMLSHSLLLVGEKSAAQQVINSSPASISNYRELGGTFGSSIRDQALIIRVLLDRGERLKAKRLIDEMLPYFSGPKKRYLSTQDIAQCLISFAKFAGTLETIEDSIECQIQLSPNGTLNTSVIADRPEILTLSDEDITTGQISIKNQGSQELFSSLVVSGLPARDSSPPDHQDLDLQIAYFSSAGQVNPSEIVQGSDFIVRITIKHPGQRMDYENMALTSIFPSGWEILNDRLNKNSSDPNAGLADYMDIRDDRVNIYFELDKGKSKTFEFKLNATYAGKYWAPPVFCEAMYDASIRAKSAGFWVDIQSGEDK